MRKVELRMNEQEKYEVIKELVDYNGNKNRASKMLGISRRQIDWLIIKYKANEKSSIKLKNLNITYKFQLNLHTKKQHFTHMLLFYIFITYK